MVSLNNPIAVDEQEPSYLVATIYLNGFGIVRFSFVPVGQSAIAAGHAV